MRPVDVRRTLAVQTTGERAVMIQDYNATVDLDHPAEDGALTYALLSGLVVYSVAVAGSNWNHLQVIITLPAHTLTQAASTAIAVVSAAAPGVSLAAIEVMTTAGFDGRIDSLGSLDEVPAVVGVTEAAASLGISAQAVRQLIRRGTLPAARAGRRGWAIPTAAVAARIAAAKR